MSVSNAQQVESSLEGSHRKKNILIIQTQQKSFSNLTHSPLCLVTLGQGKNYRTIRYHIESQLFGYHILNIFNTTCTLSIVYSVSNPTTGR
jgi:hypothetical protein